MFTVFPNILVHTSTICSILPPNFVVIPICLLAVYYFLPMDLNVCLVTTPPTWSDVVLLSCLSLFFFSIFVVVATAIIYDN